MRLAILTALTAFAALPTIAQERTRETCEFRFNGTFTERICKFEVLEPCDDRASPKLYAGARSETGERLDTTPRRADQPVITRRACASQQTETRKGRDVQIVRRGQSKVIRLR